MMSLDISHWSRKMRLHGTLYVIIQSHRFKPRHALHDELNWLLFCTQVAQIFSSESCKMRVFTSTYFLYASKTCIRASRDDIELTAEINICRSMLEMFRDENWR